MFHCGEEVRPKPFETFQGKANSQNFLTPSEISQAQDSSQIQIPLHGNLCSTRNQAMENKHRRHPTHLPHSSIKNCFKGRGGGVWPQIRRSISSDSCMFTFVLSAYWESQMWKTDRVQWLMSCLHTGLFWTPCQKIKSFKNEVFYRRVKLGGKKWKPHFLSFFKNYFVNTSGG